jgi:hypothetical protein
MASPTVQAPTDIRTTKRADDLSAGDRIAPGFLPTGQPAEVLFVQPYELKGEAWVRVVYQFEDGDVDSDRFTAGGRIWVDRLAPSDRTCGLPEPHPVPNTITEQRFPVRRYTQNAGPR